MERSQRVKYAALTAPTQLALSVVLAVVLALLVSDSNGEWADVIGVVLGIGFGPPLGLVLMVVLVLRAQGKSMGRALLTGAVSALVAFTAIVLMLNSLENVFAMLAVVAVSSTVAVWILSGRE